jgi:hypothetical protein
MTIFYSYIFFHVSFTYHDLSFTHIYLSSISLLKFIFLFLPLGILGVSLYFFGVGDFLKWAPVFLILIFCFVFFIFIHLFIYL